MTQPMPMLNRLETAAAQSTCFHSAADGGFMMCRRVLLWNLSQWEARAGHHLQGQVMAALQSAHAAAAGALEGPGSPLWLCLHLRDR